MVCPSGSRRRVCCGIGSVLLVLYSERDGCRRRPANVDGRVRRTKRALIARSICELGGDGGAIGLEPGVEHQPRNEPKKKKAVFLTGPAMLGRAGGSVRVAGGGYFIAAAACGEMGSRDAVVMSCIGNSGIELCWRQRPKGGVRGATRARFERVRGEGQTIGNGANCLLEEARHSMLPRASGSARWSPHITRTHRMT